LFQRNLYRKSKHTFYVQGPFFFLKNCAVYEIMGKNNVESDRPQRTVWRLRIAFFVPKATNTCSECVILIAFLLHQWLHTRSSIRVLRYTYIACLVVCSTWALLRPVQRAQARYEVLTAAWLRIQFFWDMTLCRRVSISRRFGGT